MNAIKIALAVTYFWAYIGYIISKAFLLFFCLLMKLPEICYNIPECLLNIENTYNNKISVLEATANEKNVTNRFKLFIKLYMEEAIDKKGIDFRKFMKIFNSSVLYCCYVIANETHSVIVEKRNDKYIKTKNNVEEELSMKIVDFDGDKKADEFDLDELSNLLKDFD
jgi:hypothetical protein